MFCYLFDFVFIFTEPTLPNHDLFCLHATRHFVSLKRFVRSDHQSGAALITFSLENGILLTRSRESPKKRRKNLKNRQGWAPSLLSAMSLLSKGRHTLLLILALGHQANLLATATAACGEATIVEQEKSKNNWKPWRLLRKEGNTRWMAEEGGFFVLDLGCQKIIKGAKVDNRKKTDGNTEGRLRRKFLSKEKFLHITMSSHVHCPICYKTLSSEGPLKI